MPMHISPSTDRDPGRITTMLSQMGSITNSLSPATQNDILGILQQEQDHAMSLLSLSPLLSSLFISYANRVVALESASATPSPDSEEWETLQVTIAALREENGKLESENCEMAGKLEAAAASQEAFRTLVMTLKEDAETQLDGFRMLTQQCTETNNKYNRFVAKSATEMTSLQAQILDLEKQREELKETVVGQQVKISKLKRQGVNCPSNLPTAATPIEAEECSEQEAGKQVEKGPREKLNKVTGGRTKKTTQKAKKDAREKAERESREVNGRLGKEEKEGPEWEFRWIGVERGPSRTESTPPALTLGLGLGAPETTPELLGTPKEIKDVIPTTAVRQSQVPAPSSVTAKAEPEKPLSLWDRKKKRHETATLPVLSSSVHDQKRDQQEDVVEGLLGSSSARKRSAPAPAPAPLAVSPGWGAWGSSLQANIPDQVTSPEMLPSPGPLFVSAGFGSTLCSGTRSLSINTPTKPPESATTRVEIFPPGYRD